MPSTIFRPRMHLVLPDTRKRNGLLRPRCLPVQRHVWQRGVPLRVGMGVVRLQRQLRVRIPWNVRSGFRNLHLRCRRSPGLLEWADLFHLCPLRSRIAVRHRVPTQRLNRRYLLRERRLHRFWMPVLRQHCDGLLGWRIVQCLCGRVLWHHLQVRVSWRTLPGMQRTRLVFSGHHGKRCVHLQRQLDGPQL
jgi:hypothetical protein